MFFYLNCLIYIGIIYCAPCKEGTNFCFRCNPISKLCEKCQNNILVPDKNGGCEPIKKCRLESSYCLECQEESIPCKKCEEGYFPDENGGCSLTKNCDISYQGECLKCKENFILIGIDLKICKSLNSEDLKNCDIINTVKGKCDSCKEGYFLNIGDKKCISTENCQYSSFGVCEKCASNYYLDKKKGRCIEQKDNFLNCIQSVDGINCDICEDDYYFDDEGKCISNNYCLKESYIRKCEKCNDGYFLTENGNSCTKERNCYYGDKNMGICKECKTGYYIDYKDGKCKSNEEENDFKYCKIADGECMSCIYRTYLGKDNKCSLTKNCLESEKGICRQCLDDYHLCLDSKCTNIDKCIFIDDTTNYYDICIECEDGFFYNKTSKLCEVGENSFKNCKISTFDGHLCEKCKNNFYLNMTDNLCYNNSIKDNFYKCASTDKNGEYCKECVEGYYIGYIDHKCTTIDGCDISENENKCLKCDTDYFFCLDKKTGKCVFNDEVMSEEKKFYYKCNITNEEGTACEICLDGFELKNGLCIEDSHCIEKNEDGFCKKCINYEDEYYKHCLNYEFDCVETYLEGYDECNYSLDFNNCTKCFEGYELDKNGECIEIKNKLVN